MRPPSLPTLLRTHKQHEQISSHRAFLTARRTMVGTARTAGRVTVLDNLHFAQRAFCAAAMRLRAAGDIVFLAALITTTFRPLVFAQRAR